MKTNQKSQKPYAVYVVEGEGDKAYWTKIGAAWAHEEAGLRASERNVRRAHNADSGASRPPIPG
jgi:hypothetical protein